MRTLLAGLLLTLCAARAAEIPAAPPESGAVDALLSDDSLWTLPTNVFFQKYRFPGLRWMDANTTARSAFPRLNLGGQRIWELLISFKAGLPQQITLSLYNRGDAGDLSETNFRNLVAATERELSEWARTSPGPVTEIRGPAQTKRFVQTWVKGPSRAALEWSSSKDRQAEGGAAGFRAEYVRLRLTPAAAAGAAAPPEGAAPAPVSAMGLRAHVRRDANGDLCIPDVPMVDQGDKGYCADAVTERVMRYFGADFDQHQAAQIAGSSSEGGTSEDALVSAVRRIAGSRQMNFRELIAFETQDYLKLIKDYNRAAEKANRPPIQTGAMIDLDRIFAAMDPALLKEARARRGAERARFQSQITQQIQAGVPLLWGVHLGIVQEIPRLPQASGGHMRLIIGYNSKTSEVLYTDTWGRGHELKRMTLDDAWTITTGLYAVVPRNVR